jgi:hypothetical protein
MVWSFIYPAENSFMRKIIILDLAYQNLHITKLNPIPSLAMISLALAPIKLG